MVERLGNVPLFMLKREYFDQIKRGKKDVELRSAKGPWKNAKPGDTAVLMSGRSLERKTIKKVHKGTLTEILATVDHERIIPESKSRREAVKAIKKLYPREERFMAFEL